MQERYHIKDTYSQDTGGGMECDVLLLEDGTVLVISEEAIVLYQDTQAWEEGPSQQLGVIFRHSDQNEQNKKE